MCGLTGCSGNGVCGRANGEGGDFCRVQPCHAQPADGEEGVEYKEEDSLRMLVSLRLKECGSGLTASRPRLELPMLLVAPASTAMEKDMPAAPKIIKERRPNLSIVNIAIQLAIQYSVPLHADSRRLRKGERPMEFSKIELA
jgi:hypothetical protein